MTIMPQATTQPLPQSGAQSGADVAPAKAPSVIVYSDGQTKVLQFPTTHDEMATLISRRQQLSDQLNSVTQRRDGLIEQMKESPEAALPALRAQLDALQPRIVQLEGDLAQVGREIAGASPDVISMLDEPPPPPDYNGTFGEGGAAFGVPIFLVMAAFYLFQRRRWQKAARRTPPALPSADSERLQRLENGMEAISIEIERISEGQRFVTKLLSEPRATDSVPR